MKIYEFVIEESHKINIMFQIYLMVASLILESGQTVQLFVEKLLKIEQGLVLTLLQLMVVQIVLGKCLKVDLA